MKEKEAYKKSLWKKLDFFVEDTKKRPELYCEDIKFAVQRYERDLKNTKYEFRKEAVDKFWNFCYYIKINMDYGFLTFEPEPWQVFYLANIYGFYLANTKIRRFTVSFLSIARKNGKTTLGAIQALYHLTKENVDAQVYFISVTRDLATNALKTSKSLVKHSKALKSRVQNMQYQIRYENSKTSSFLKAATGDADSLNSIRPAFALIDETHLMPSSDIVNMAKGGQKGVHNPLISMTTTRGNNSTGWFQYGYEIFLQKMLRQEVEDERTFAMIFSLDHENEIKDTTKWVKSNPNLMNKELLTIDELKDDFDQRKGRLSELKNFVIFNLNFWYRSASDRWIDMEAVEKCFVQNIEHDLESEECYVGIDLSATRDLTSVSFLYPPNLEHDYFVVENVCMMTNLENNTIRKTGIDLSEYIESGELIALDRKTIDYDKVYDIISEKSWINKLGYDSYNAQMLISKLQDNDIDCQSVGMSAGNLNQGTKFLEKLIYDGNIRFDNRVAKWQFGNVVCKTTEDNNQKPSKTRSRDAIDSVISMIVALSVYLDDQGGEINYEGVSL